MDSLHARLCCVLLIAVLPWMPGCSGNGGYEAVSGSVTFQGQPLKEGSIQFFTPGEPPTVAGGAAIVDGKYAIPGEHGLKPGSYLVRISSTERTERASRDGVAMSGFKIRERLPAKYNSECTLKVEIGAGQRGPVDFTLD
jgi:hypothetical protein